MKSFVFISNALTPHQQPFCQSMAALLGKNFHFIENVGISDERKKMGWQIQGEPSYLLSFKQKPDLCVKLLSEADFVIVGSSPENLLKERIKAGKILLRYCERPLKKGLEPLKYLPRLLKWHYINPDKKPIYMLCASGYTAGDYAKFGLFKNKTFKWGYFPQTQIYDENIFNNKSTTKKVSILWCGRFLRWKHPEVAIRTAQRLSKAGYDFTLNVIGMGPLEQELKQAVLVNNLGKNVHFLGAMPPEKVRNYMEKTDIFWFTSDFYEGWGAVLNEAMNSACAVIASHAVGSAAFLLQHTKNGLIYKNADEQDLYNKTIYLIENPKERILLGKNAYATISKLWNAKTASQRLLSLCDNLQQGNGSFFTEGPCSPAEPISQKDMYEYLTKNKKS